jgi:hypothetical protein
VGAAKKWDPTWFFIERTAEPRPKNIPSGQSGSIIVPVVDFDPRQAAKAWARIGVEVTPDRIKAHRGILEKWRRNQPNLHV